MKAFGAQYARQVTANAKHLAQTLHKLGLGAECADLGFTESHQVAVDVKNLGGGGRVGDLLKDNDIIVNRNLLPHDPPKQVVNPSGIRLGVQEMTRFGMNEPEMEEIARLIKAAVADGTNVKDEVNRFRGRFQSVKYSFDDAHRPPASGVGAPAAIDVDMAGY
jgi:glycine hydroxymethyltransferase